MSDYLAAQDRYYKPGYDAENVESWVFRTYGRVFKAQFGMDGSNYLLNLKQPPTAIVCFNDMLAIGVLKGCRRAGLNVPDDISITGFDNIIFSAYTHPPLTTFDQPKQSIGTEAARLLLDLLHSSPDGKVFQPKEIILKGRLLVRNSTAASPKEH